MRTVILALALTSVKVEALAAGTRRSRTALGLKLSWSLGRLAGTSSGVEDLAGNTVGGLGQTLARTGHEVGSESRRASIGANTSTNSRVEDLVARTGGADTCIAATHAVLIEELHLPWWTSLRFAGTASATWRYVLT